MKKIERNAILAGLRCLQAGFSTGRLTHDMFDILNDGIDKPITLGAIDTLCEQINFSEVDFERPDYGEFEVERVHLPINEPTAEVCKEGTCGNRHYFAVYKRDPKNGLADWQSDHATEQLARTAAAAYRSGAITRAHDENIAGLAAQVGYELGAKNPRALKAREIMSHGDGWAGFIQGLFECANVLTEVEGVYLNFDWYDTIDALTEAFIADPSQSRSAWKETIARLRATLDTKAKETR